MEFKYHAMKNIVFLYKLTINTRIFQFKQIQKIKRKEIYISVFERYTVEKAPKGR